MGQMLPEAGERQRGSIFPLHRQWWGKGKILAGYLDSRVTVACNDGPVGPVGIGGADNFTK